MDLFDKNREEVLFYQVIQMVFVHHAKLALCALFAFD